MNVNRVVGAPAGIIRVRVSGAEWSDTVVRKTARSYAMREAHTLVGGAQNVRQDGADTLVDFAVVTRTAKDAHPADAPVEVPTVDGRTVPAVDVHALMARIDALAAQVAALTGATPVTTPVATPKAPREVPAFIVDRAKAREAATCKLCRDFGVVRASGPDAGKPYRTANGAAGATASKPCTCKAGKRAAKRTA